MSKERPIIFSGPMVQAILSGAKIQTRRVIKPQPPEGGGIAANSGAWAYIDCNGEILGRLRCPYEADMTLWVRETWRVNGNKHDYARATRDDVFYRADEPWNADAGWRPSIFMPRWASRISLEITGVRVERLGDIGASDAVAEGVELSHYYCEEPTAERDGIHRCNPVARFAELWDSINGKRGYPWASSPWVWVIEFRRIQSLARNGRMTTPTKSSPAGMRR